MSSTHSLLSAAVSSSFNPSTTLYRSQHGDVIHAAFDETPNYPRYEGVAVLCTSPDSGDGESLSLVLPSRGPHATVKVRIEAEAFTYCEPIPLMPIRNVRLEEQSRWCYTSGAQAAQELLLSQPSLLGSKVHKRTLEEFESVQSYLDYLGDLETAAKKTFHLLGQSMMDRAAYLSWVCQLRSRRSADFLYQCIDDPLVTNQRTEVPPIKGDLKELVSSVPPRLAKYLSKDCDEDFDIDVSMLMPFSSLRNRSLNKISLELDILLLKDNKVKSRTLNSYLFYKSLLTLLFEEGISQPELWDCVQYVQFGNKILHEIILLLRLASTGKTAHVDQLRKALDMTFYPDTLHCCMLRASWRSDLIADLTHLTSKHLYEPPTTLDYYNWSVDWYPRLDGCHCRSEDSLESPVRPVGDLTSPTGIAGSGRQMHSMDHQIAHGESVEGSGECIQEDTAPCPSVVTNPFGRKDIRTSSHWLKRGFVEKVSSASQSVGWNHGLTDSALRRELEVAAAPHQEAGSSRRWLSYFIEDFYNLNYHMFLDFSEWIKPKRSHTLQGNLAPIATNLLNLEKMEQLDPELTPLYNLLRHEDHFDRLTVPGKKSSVSDRVRLTQGQVDQAEDWKVIERVDVQPPSCPVGMFTVAKKPPNPDLRLIVDGRPFNETQERPEKMPIPKLLNTILGIQGMNFTVQYDGVSFFYQFPMRHNRFYFRRRGKYYKFCRMPMGWSWAPLIAQRTANAILAETLRRFRLIAPVASVYTACWVDNFLLAAKTQEDLKVLEELFLQVAEEVCMKVKKEDQIDNQHTVFAGIEHDLVRHRYRPVASTHQVEEVTTVRDVMKVCGTAIWQLYARGSRLCFFENLISTVSRLCAPAMRGECDWDASIERSLRKSDLADINALKSIGADQKWETLGHSRATFDDPVWFDASSYVWGFVSDSGHKGAQGRFASPEQLHIFCKEAIAFLSAVNCTIPEFQGRHRVFYTDNQPLAKAFQKGHSSSRFVNDILRHVFTSLQEHDATLELNWIPTHINKADKFTRGASISMPNKYKERVFLQPLVRKHTHHSMVK